MATAYAVKRSVGTARERPRSGEGDPPAAGAGCEVGAYMRLGELTGGEAFGGDCCGVGVVSEGGCKTTTGGA